MKMDLGIVAPETVTECALLEYAKHLERRVAAAENHTSRDEMTMTMDEEIMPSHIVDSDTYVRVASMSFRREDIYNPGYPILLKTRPLTDVDDWREYRASIFIPSHKAVGMKDSTRLNFLGELYKHGLRQIAEAFRKG